MGSYKSKLSKKRKWVRVSMSSLIYTTLELSLIGSLTVLGLYLSYFTLNVCDLSTDGCFTLGACTASVIALSGHPFLAIPGAMLAGMASGLTVSLLQTYLGVDSLLSGIIVNTGLYSIGIAIMGNSSFAVPLFMLIQTERTFPILISASDPDPGLIVSRSRPRSRIVHI